uniref:Uncharacterized protein n=1 Tax=Schistosoma curassoni TaxID=6186 RepID=A0A183JY15_9TREM
MALKKLTFYPENRRLRGGLVLHKFVHLALHPPTGNVITELHTRLNKHLVFVVVLGSLEQL